MQIAILEKDVADGVAIACLKAKKVLIALNVVYLTDSIPRYVRFSGPKMEMGTRSMVRLCIKVFHISIIIPGYDIHNATLNYRNSYQVIIINIRS